ncbi:S1C family serine protease [Haloferula rosea]|uniref:PDZ domain-containing protein n=1 Tax=Haloferula rosea TaxID=490093 RepID=A0A934RDH8_9BACT|nr:PDZ domain-containing protein [Haloferula rosea]MBK1828743.1 PDZ domain-containing protein [Haloferula rosea]
MKTIPTFSNPGMLSLCACLALPALAQQPERSDRAPAVDVEIREIKPGDAPARRGGDRPNLDRVPDEVREMIRPMLRQMQEATREETRDAVRPQWRIGLGAGAVEPVLRKHLDLPKEGGLQVTEVMPGSPAAKAGIKPGDILLGAGDRKTVSSLDELKEAVQASGRAGQPLSLRLIQAGKRKEVKVTPDGPPAMREQARERQMGHPGAAGDAAPRIMMEMNRRFERMEAQLRQMRQQIERQQRVIEELRRSNERARGNRTPQAETDRR